MSEFRTIVSPSPSAGKISLNDRVMTIGSCFSEAIGGRLSLNKIPTLVNPFGVVYNPISLHRVLTNALLKKNFFPAHDLKMNDSVVNYDIHSSFRGADRADFERKA